MKAAILMASYNGKKYIREQIESILCQTFTDWQLYINDDGSTDGTVGIINEYAARFPDKIRLSFNESGRHSPKDNYADLFRKVPEADWYVLCDQDDIWLHDRLEKMLLKAKAEGVCGDSIVPAIVYGRAEVVDEKLRKMGDSIEGCIHIRLREDAAREQILLTGYIWGCTMMYNAALRDFVQYIPEGALYHDVYLEIVCVFFGKIIALEDTVVKYRQHGDNTSLGVYPILKDICRRLRDWRGIMNRIRIFRDRTRLQMLAFLEQFGERLSGEDKRRILDCIRILGYRSRVHSVVAAVRKRYLRWDGYYKYIVFLFIVKGKAEAPEKS